MSYQMTEHEWSGVINLLRDFRANLESINVQLKKFLEMQGSPIPRWGRGSHSTSVRAVSSSAAELVFCSWCLGEVEFRCGEPVHVCDHGVLCEACAPCDECG